MQEDRTDAVDADEDWGRSDEKYEINSMGEPERTGLQGRSRHMNTRN